ncbi:MAG: hypothetical protein ACTS2F_16445 [Thainema sp.]
MSKPFLITIWFLAAALPGCSQADILSSSANTSQADSSQIRVSQASNLPTVISTGDGDTLRISRNGQ